MTAIFDDLLAAADDLDRLEELDPRPGRVGLANRLRRAVREVNQIAWCEVHGIGDTWLEAEQCLGANFPNVYPEACRMVRRPLLKSDAADT